MKCRRMKDNNIVRFGSYGVNEDGTAKFVNDTDKHDNYASEAEGVATSLTQRLYVIKHELWYDYEYGLPLIDKVKSKGIFDNYILTTISKHSDVLEIVDFISVNNKHNYMSYVLIKTIYGEIGLSI